jgi:hypothetical protein
MLAAVPDSSFSLGLLEAVLTSMSNEEKPVLSDALKTHFLLVLQNGAVLANNPDKIDAKTSSEEIEFAYRVRGKEKVIEKIIKLDNFGNIKSADAKLLLDSLKKYAT